MIINQILNSIGDEFTQLLYSTQQKVNDPFFKFVTGLIQCE